MIKTDIILAGVGGQGILSIAAAIGYAAVKNNLYLKQAEVHGMSQRGGAVQSNLRVSEREIFSDLIPYKQADLILSVEPMEALRYLPYLSPNGWLVTSSNAYKNIDSYPEDDMLSTRLHEVNNVITIDAELLAKKLGSSRSSNMIMLGAGSPFIHIPAEDIRVGIRELFSNKGDEIVKLNISAFNEGRKIAESKIND